MGNISVNAIFFTTKLCRGGGSDGDNTAMATATSPLTPFCHDSDTGNNDGDAGEWTVTGGTAGKDIAVDAILLTTKLTTKLRRGGDGRGR